MNLLRNQPAVQRPDQQVRHQRQPVLRQDQYQPPPPESFNHPSSRFSDHDYRVNPGEGGNHDYRGEGRSNQWGHSRAPNEGYNKAPPPPNNDYNRVPPPSDLYNRAPNDGYNRIPTASDNRARTDGYNRAPPSDNRAPPGSVAGGYNRPAQEMSDTRSLQSLPNPSRRGRRGGGSVAIARGRAQQSQSPNYRPGYQLPSGPPNPSNMMTPNNMMAPNNNMMTPNNMMMPSNMPNNMPNMPKTLANFSLDMERLHRCLPTIAGIHDM
eukprot:sb/3468299/